MLRLSIRQSSVDFLVKLYFLCRNEDLHDAADSITKELRRRGLNVHDAFDSVLLDGASSSDAVVEIMRLSLKAGFTVEVNEIGSDKREITDKSDIEKYGIDYDVDWLEITL